MDLEKLKSFRGASAQRLLNAFNNTEITREEYRLLRQLEKEHAWDRIEQPIIQPTITPVDSAPANFAHAEFAPAKGTPVHGAPADFTGAKSTHAILTSPLLETRREVRQLTEELVSFSAHKIEENEEASQTVYTTKGEPIYVGKVQFQKGAYGLLDNDVLDVLLGVLDPAMVAVYLRLYRLSYMFRKNWCCISKKKLYEEFKMSPRTVDYAMQRLYEAQLVKVLKKAKNQYESSFYRVFLPWEIGLASDPSVSYLVSESEDSLIVKNTRAPVNSTPAKSTGAKHESVLNTYINTLSKRTTPLSDENPIPIVEFFYQKIGHTRISKQKRERALQDIQELQNDGFLITDIAFAVKWTTENISEPLYDFSIVKHTIGQALSEREKTLEQQAQEEKVEAERQKLQRQEEARRAAETLAEQERQQRREASPWKETWEQIADELAQQMPHQSFCTWIQPLFLVDLHDTAVVIDCPSQFIKEYLEKEYRSVIKEAVTTVCSAEKQVVFVCGDSDVH